MVDAINLNRFYSPLTRDYLSQGTSSLRVYGPYGQQSALSPLSGKTQYTLSSLYGGNNPYLPNIQVNGSQTSAAALQAYQAGVYGIQAGSTTAARNDAFELSFNAQGRPTLSTTSPSNTPAAFPTAYSESWIARRNLSEANLAQLLSDPAHTDIVLRQLGLTLQSDGAGNVVNVSDSLNLNQILPQLSPPNTAAFGLREIFLPGATEAISPAALAKPTSLNAAANTLSQINLPINGLEGQGRPQQVSSANPPRADLGGSPPRAISNEQSLQQALLSAAQQSISSTKPALSIAPAINTASISTGIASQQDLLAGSTAQQLRLAAAQAHYTPLTQITPAERNGIIPLVQPQAPLNTAPANLATTGGSENPFSGIQTGIDPNSGGGQGAALLPQLFAGLGGNSQGGQSFTPQGRPAAIETGLNPGQAKKRPLSFIA